MDTKCIARDILIAFAMDVNNALLNSYLHDGYIQFARLPSSPTMKVHYT